MIKKVIVLSALLILVLPLQRTSSQGGQITAEQALEQLFSQTEVTPINWPAPEAPAGAEPIYTHPEFTGIVTATVTISATNTADGYLFVGAPGLFYDGPAAAVIFDNSGEPIFIRTAPDDHFVTDVKVQTVNGSDYLTYQSGYLPGGYSFGSSYVLNQSYELVDTWTIDNGNGSDLHEFLLLDNGHAILMAYVPTPFDFTPYGGPANGTLIDIVLQEQDADHNVVFEWRGSDHMPLEDSEANYNTTNPVDFLHTNGIDVDDDGNWLLSHRNFSEITKINRQTGDIIWRMGGAGNEFTFTNDIGFLNQHNINRLPNGNITLFDNGTTVIRPFSRAIEYAVDENAKTVTRVWMYPEDTSEFSSVMSSIQRLPNGNSMIGWGSQPKLSEVQSDGTIVHELALGAVSYRAFRFPWTGVPAAAPRGVVRYDGDPTAVTVYTSWNGATDIVSYDIFAGPTINSLTMIGNAPKTGFETAVSLTNLPPDTCFFQTQPIQAQANPTPTSNIMYRLDLQVCWDQLEHAYLPIFTK